MANITFFVTSRQHKSLGRRQDVDDTLEPERLIYGDFGISIPGLVRDHTRGNAFAIERNSKGVDLKSRKRCFFFFAVQSYHATITMYYNQQESRNRNPAASAGGATVNGGMGCLSTFGTQHMLPRQGFIGHGLCAFMTFGERYNCSVTDLYIVEENTTLKQVLKDFKTDCQSYRHYLYYVCGWTLFCNLQPQQTSKLLVARARPTRGSNYCTQ